MAEQRDDIFYDGARDWKPIVTPEPPPLQTVIGIASVEYVDAVIMKLEARIAALEARMNVIYG